MHLKLIKTKIPVGIILFFQILIICYAYVPRCRQFGNRDQDLGVENGMSSNFT